ncbi:MAG: restriction endonuclease subunit S [Pseudomonadota bacterium]
MSVWVSLKLEEIVNSANTGLDAIRRAPIVEEDTGIKCLRIQDVSQSKPFYRWGNSKVNAKDYERAQLRTDDLIMARTCSPGIVYHVRNDMKAVFNNGLARIRPNTSKTTSLYLYYVFKSPDFIGHVYGISGGTSVQLNMKLGDLLSYEMYLPSLEEQKAIAAVLSSLDDKIDLLHRQNQTLEAMAATLFRQWFVEEAQEDWKDGVISDLLEFNPPRKLTKGTIAPYLEMASLSTDTFNPEGWYDREFSSGTKFMNGDTLLARITPCLENGKTAYVTIFDKDQVGWGSTEYIVMRPKGDLHPFFAYVLARNGDFRDFAEGCLAGSSGRQRVETNHLMSYKIKIPPVDIVKKFNVVAE